jgi:predicted RNase H-like HicB family nuclease
MNDPRFDGYTLTLFHDGEHWLAHFAEMPEIAAFAVTPEHALRELQTVWGMVKADYRDSGKPVPVAPRSRQAA